MMVCLIICPPQRDDIREYLGKISTRPFGAVNAMFEVNIVLFDEFSIMLILLRRHGRNKLAEVETTLEYRGECVGLTA